MLGRGGVSTPEGRAAYDDFDRWLRADGHARNPGTTADLVGYLEWMAEPASGTRKKLGVWVLFLMSTFALFAWLLSKSYWKEVK